MKKYSIVLIMTLILALLIAGCTPSVTGPADETDPIDLSQMYRIGSISEPTTFCPIFSTDARSSFIINLMFDSLLDTDENLELIGQIAETWEVSDDGLELTFFLRDDVYWHDGEQLKADDVAFTYNILLHDDYTGVRKEVVKHVDSVEAVNDFEFKIYMNQVDAPLMFATAASSTAIMPKHIFHDTPIKEMKEHENSWDPIGSGPYKFKEYTAGQRIVLEANEEYYGGSPAIKGIIEKIYQDIQVMLAAFENDDIDHFADIPKDDIERLQEQLGDRINFKRTTNLAYDYIGLKQNHPIFKDKMVRQAMKYALDRPNIIDTIFRGYGTMVNSHGIPFQWSYSPDVNPYHQDVDLAVSMLEDAGWDTVGDDGIRLNEQGDRFEFTLVTGTGDEERSNILAMIKEQWKAVGIDMTVEEMETSVLFEQYLDAFEFEAYNWGWNLGLDPDATNFFHSDSGRNEDGIPQGFNDVEIYNAELDQLLNAGRATYDLEERKEIYHQLQEVLNEELPYIWLHTTDDMEGMNKRIKDVVWSPIEPIWIHKWSIEE